MHSDTLPTIWRVYFGRSYPAPSVSDVAAVLEQAVKLWNNAPRAEAAAAYRAAVEPVAAQLRDRQYLSPTDIADLADAMCRGSAAAERICDERPEYARPTLVCAVADMRDTLRLLLVVQAGLDTQDAARWAQKVSVAPLAQSLWTANPSPILAPDACAESWYEWIKMLPAEKRGWFQADTDARRNATYSARATRALALSLYERCRAPWQKPPAKRDDGGYNIDADGRTLTAWTAALLRRIWADDPRLWVLRVWRPATCEGVPYVVRS